MGLNCGIVGLPNVGKSTIFNALTAAHAPAENYPFCTIDPNVGIVSLNDQRLIELSAIAKSAKIIQTTVEFVDIAGLVAGASKGEGLGNQFLGHIRAVDAIVHVVRCFEDSNVTHVYEKVSPLRDIEIIETELILADLGVVEKRLERSQKMARLGDKGLLQEVEELEALNRLLSSGAPARNMQISAPLAAALGLITAKPVLFVANVAESDASREAAASQAGPLGEVARAAAERGSSVVVLSASVEAEIAQLAPEDRAAFLADLGLKEAGLERLALTAYKLLNLITFFTAGPKEARAWTCTGGTTIVDAAGKIHTDFARGFIRAEVISYDDYVRFNGEAGARDNAALRIEGRDYVVRDGDVVHIRFNV